MRDRNRLNHRIAQSFIMGGYNDTRRYKPCLSRLYRHIESSRAVRTSDRLVRYYHGNTQRWRGAISFDEALRVLIKNYHIPLWFLKRHIDYIATKCLWEKSSSWGNYRYFKESVPIEEKDGLKYAGSDGWGMLLSCDLPEKMTRRRDVEVIIDGEKYKKEEKYTVEEIYIDTTREMGVISSEVGNLYRNIQHRYYRIFGIDCKMCKKNVKHKKTDIICNDMVEYIDHFCPHCLTKFCKLTEAAKGIKMKKLAA